MIQTNKELKIAVCDDDPADSDHLLGILREYIDKKDCLVKIDLFETGEAFLESDTASYGLVFLDIFMPGIGGIAAAEELFKDNKTTKIIFCSSSTEFGVQSYDVNAMRYLVKPASKARVFEALDLFFDVYTTLRTITVKVDRIDETIYVNDIIWIENDRHHCIIHTVKGDVVTRATFVSLKEKLPDGEFICPIRYAMVAFKAIDGIPGADIKLVDSTVIPVSKDQREKVKKAYMDYCWNKMYKQGV